ncbi:putative transporter [Pseudoloma neurophilia]|uniref:Putative transporter n=1 Tax=Pseudoloma neurophilia TaxID=146866 RepID=A0A0R0LY56_9MICR|nr:putative transporter [Pseudoloma neurophilia]
MLHYHSDIKDMPFIEFISKLVPFIIVSNCLKIMRNISIQRETSDLRKLIFPTIIEFFLPPLVANLIYKQFILNNMVLTSVACAILSFPVFNRLPVLLFWTTKFGKIGTILFLRALRDNKQPISHITMWPVLSDFIGIFISKIFAGEKDFEVSEQTFLGIMLKTSIIYLSRTLKLNDSQLLLAVVLVEIGMFSYDRLSNTNDSETKQNVKSLLHIFNMHKKSNENQKGHVKKPSKKKTLEKIKTDTVILAEKVEEPEIDDPFETDTIQIDESENTVDFKNTKRRGRPKKNSTVASKKSSKKKT